LTTQNQSEWANAQAADRETLESVRDIPPTSPLLRGAEPPLLDSFLKQRGISPQETARSYSQYARQTPAQTLDSYSRLTTTPRNLSASDILDGPKETTSYSQSASPSQMPGYRREYREDNAEKIRAQQRALYAKKQPEMVLAASEVITANGDGQMVEPTQSEFLRCGYTKDGLPTGRAAADLLTHLSQQMDTYHQPSHLPTSAAERKRVPLYSGLMKYFPDALVAVASLSYVGNEQHNPGKPLHWDRNKSTDQHDTIMRHLLEAGTMDTDGVRHSAKVAWRALAALQLEIEADKGAVQG
jgi:hypothetical protein